MIYTPIYWLIAAIILFVIELGGPGNFLFFSFSCGALFGMVASWLGFGLVAQSTGAVLITGIAFGLLYMWIKKDAKRFNKKKYESNVYTLIGQKGHIIKPPSIESFGQVKIGGQVWSCKVRASKTVHAGDQVCIVEVKGAHVIVDEEIAEKKTNDHILEDER